ncbi:ABC transporter substrate-binding protein [Lentzea sp. NPDC058436]|uniref:ABC transporter substrate-binding protein n=1 Tax=Lentzea sp. NPDC058436 TaxID=3346499 RepID=UPI003668C407
MTMTPLRRLAALLSAALVLSACGSGGDNTATAPAQTRTVKAGNGSVEVPADPKRVVTIGNTTLPFIDMGGSPVGVTEVTASELGLIPEDQKAKFTAATNVGASGDQVDMEKLAALKPDLILAQLPDSEFQQIEKQLKSIAPTLYWGLDTEWKALAGSIAEAGNVTAALGAQQEEFKKKIAKIQETYREVIGGTSFVNVDRWESSDPGTFSVADFGCVEIAQDDIGMKFPKAAEGQDPLGWTSLPFEQIAELAKYDVITYPVDADGKAKPAFAPVVETNTWKALPAVSSGRALGLFCPGNNSYQPVLRYLDSLDRALATLPAKK